MAARGSVALPVTGREGTGPKPPSGIDRGQDVEHQPTSHTLVGAPGTTRTCDLGIRRPLLYPPELRRQCAGQSIQAGFKIRLGDATRPKILRLGQKSVIV